MEPLLRPVPGLTMHGATRGTVIALTTAAQIQAALQQLNPAAGPGGKILIADGDYEFDAPLLIGAPYTVLEGSGHTLLHFKSATDGLLIGDGSRQMDYVTLRDLHIVGNSPDGGVALKITRGSEILVENVRILNQGGSSHWDVGMQLVITQKCTFEHVSVWWLDEAIAGVTDEFLIDGDSRGNTFVGCTLTGSPGTDNGVRTTGGGAEFAWIGGVIQGRFRTAGMYLSDANVQVYAPHLELVGGGGVDVIYDAGGYATSFYSPIGGSFLIGPHQDSWGFMLLGGVVDSVTLGPFARCPVISPTLASSVVDNGATDPTFGPFRILGQTHPQAARGFYVPGN
jgi:hypothetical protein